MPIYDTRAGGQWRIDSSPWSSGEPRNASDVEVNTITTLDADNDWGWPSMDLRVSRWYGTCQLTEGPNQDVSFSERPPGMPRCGACRWSGETTTLTEKS
ncbi:MAG: hypothetical protein ACI8PZ_005607 [Myxococcota bacterium]